jgi:guanylate kinase
MNKLLIVTAPSGAGKTTLVRHLLSVFPQLAFSISATTRAKRAHETDGLDYYFLSQDDFKSKIASKSFLEYEEVYENQFYGTLLSELDRLWALGKTVSFDVDVHGAARIQRKHRSASLSLFIAPPSIGVLEQRLIARGTETPESLKKRLHRAEMEMAAAEKFDFIIYNDDLDRSKKEIEFICRKFLYA